MEKRRTLLKSSRDTKDNLKGLSIVNFNQIKMKTIDTTSPEAVALNAAVRLHPELLRNGDYPQYNGTKAAFDNLYKELFVIARDDVSLEIYPVDMVIQTWYDYQQEIHFGARQADWFLTGVI